MVTLLEQQQLSATNTHDNFTQMQSLLHSLANNQHKNDDDRVKKIQIISRDLESVLASEAPSIMRTKFTRRHDFHAVNQVCPQGDSPIIQDQLRNQDVQKMVRVLVINEPFLTT